MPGYKSKTQSKKNLKSSNKAKNGGRRRKQTMKKVRRGRKVMRGGISKKYSLTPDHGMVLPSKIRELIKAGKNNTDMLEYELVIMAATNSTKAEFDLLYEAIVPVSLRTVNNNSEKIDQMLKVIIRHLSSDVIESKDKIDLPKMDQSKAVSPSEMFATQYRNSPNSKELRGDMPEVVTKGLDTGFNKGEIPRGVVFGSEYNS